MHIRILFGQRKGSYADQYGPETLEIQDEYGNEDDPTWIDEQKKIHEASGDFLSLAIIAIEIPDQVILNRLYPERKVLIPKIIDE